jgi:hypothetical protein
MDVLYHPWLQRRFLSDSVLTADQDPRGAADAVLEGKVIASDTQFTNNKDWRQRN